MVIKAFEKCIECGKLYETTSGNVSIALVATSNILGIRYGAYLPKNTPKITEILILLRILGTEIIRSDYESINKELVDLVKGDVARDHVTDLN